MKFSLRNKTILPLYFFAFIIFISPCIIYLFVFRSYPCTKDFKFVYARRYCYDHYEKKTKLFEHITGALKGTTSTCEEFRALKDVSFTVKKGETLGIIGENGSGKSTLLKIIAGVLTPDSGSVKVNGKITPFLEPGVGFNPELTAENNVRLYGAIMRMSVQDYEAQELLKRDILDILNGI